MLTPCPRGWVAQPDADGVVTCAPWPDAVDPPACADGEAWFPGGGGCTPLGPACPAGDFAADLPATGVLYVATSAAPGGDGSRGAPFGTIADALRAATPGTVVAVGKGTWDEAITVPAGVTLEGACVAETRIAPTSTTSSAAGAVVAGNGDVVRNITISGSRPGFVIEGVSAQVRDVVVDGTTVGVAAISGATLDAGGLVVRNIAGHGIELQWFPCDAASVRRSRCGGGGRVGGLLDGERRGFGGRPRLAERRRNGGRRVPDPKREHARCGTDGDRGGA